MAKQIANDSIEIVKDTASATTKAAVDIAAGSIEQLASAPSQVKADQGDKSGEKVSGGVDPNIAKKNEAERKRRYEEVKADLANYVQRKRQLDVRIAQEKAREQQEQQQKELVEKKEKESWFSKLMGRTAASSHGEVDRQKE